MKQSEKSKLTYDKILHAAIVEFGTKSYDNASLNSICNDNHISKGLIYHNFKNKDELYLCCVAICFQKLTGFLNQQCDTFGDFSERTKKLLGLRHQFFHENPYESYIFFQSILQPPNHLSKQIQQLKSEFDEFNAKQYRSLIKTVSLRDGITEEEAYNFFLLFQEMFNGYFGNKAYESPNFDTLIADHELKLSKLLNIMLYGLAHYKNDKENSEHDRTDS